MRGSVLDEMPRRTRIVVTICVALAFAGLFATVRNISESLSAGAAERQAADASADWVVTKAAWTGLDPYANTAALAHREGTVLADRTAVGGARRAAPHTRPPSALVLMAPLLLLPTRLAYLANILMNLVLVVIVARTVRRLWTVPAWAVAIGAMVALAGAAMVDALQFGVLSLLVGWLALLAYRDSRQGDRARAGVWIALAGSLKLYPLGLVALFLARGRPRAAVTAVAGFCALTGAGFLLPGVHLAGAVKAIVGASGAWSASTQNGSMALVLNRAGLHGTVASVANAALAAGLLVAVLRRHRDYSMAFFGVALVALLASPISWRHYDLMVIPALVPVLWPRRNRVVVTALGAYAAASFFGIRLLAVGGSHHWQSAHYGMLTLAGRGALMVAFLAAANGAAPMPAPVPASLPAPVHSVVDEDDVDALGSVHAHGDGHLEVARS